MDGYFVELFSEEVDDLGSEFALFDHVLENIVLIKEWIRDRLRFPGCKNCQFPF